MSRSEKINTTAVLRGFAGLANRTSQEQRMSERERVVAYWPRSLLRPIEVGTMVAPPWRMLLDPLSWKNVPPERVHEYVRTYVETHGRWPRLDDLRRQYGRVSNHRTPGEVEAQGSLL